jgi:hypothetical protein|tara:strand:+ start:52876 stop:53025 length:150 start_codon:yes stop_codon:yes gene_type:complete
MEIEVYCWGLIGLILGLAFLGLTPTVALTVLIGSGVGLIFKSRASSKYF